MKQDLKNFPKQFKIGYQAAEKIKLKKPKGICICGMGGSALPGNLLNIYLKEKNIALPFLVQRDYSLPNLVDKNWLIICISYSGNTEETLSCLKLAQKKNIALALITSNGSLKKIAENKNLPLALVPEGIQPRIALGYQFSALVGIMEKAGIVKNGKDILKLKNIKPDEKKAKQVARKLKGQIPIIYSSNKLKALARIYKMSLNETAKTPAFWNYFPELNHNEMQGFRQKQKSFYFLILEDKDDSKKIKKRMKITKNLLKKQGVKGEIIKLKGGDLLKRIFSGILFSYWSSYYLALLSNVDPEPVKLVEQFKKQMKNK